MGALNYKHLRYFWAVARVGNLTRAAAQMNVSQSALSVQIRKLEDQLGQKLFDRQGRALHLTEAGAIALGHAKAIFATGDELLAALSGATDAQPTLRVGAMASGIFRSVCCAPSWPMPTRGSCCGRARLRPFWKI